MSSPGALPPGSVAVAPVPDVEFNNRQAVPDSQQWLAGWEARSASLYADWPHVLRDLPYGNHPRQALDVFFAHLQPAPTVVYVHGGYWQWNDRSQQAFTARGLLEAGVNVAFAGYRLAPQVRMGEIVADVRAAIAKVLASLAGWGADPSGIWLVGASSGSQLAAHALDLPGVRGALLMQGLYELAPVRGTYIDDALQLSDDEIAAFSPLHMIDAGWPPVVLAAGARELPRLRQASLDVHHALSARGIACGLSIVHGHHHFSLLDELASADGVLFAALRALMRTAGRNLSTTGRSG